MNPGPAPRIRYARRYATEELGIPNPSKVCGTTSRPTELARLTYSAAFGRQLKRLRKKYRRIRDDLQPLIDDLQAGRTPGDQITGTDYTVYKVRLANTDMSRGKSGGYRVIYWLQTADEPLLLAIYSKSEQGDLSVNQIKRIVAEELDGE